MKPIPHLAIPFCAVIRLKSLFNEYRSRTKSIQRKYVQPNARFSYESLLDIIGAVKNATRKTLQDLKVTTYFAHPRQM